MPGPTDSSDGTLAIGEVAKRAGLQASAIRFYERVGLLPEPERSSGRRRYQPEVLQLLAAIEVSKDAGFTLEEIKRLFRGFDPATSPSERWAQLAEDKLHELDLLTQQIQAMRRLLLRGLECGCLTVEDCKLVAETRARAAAAKPS